MRRAAAVAAAKVAAAVSRRMRLGGGTALPGLVAERIDPRIVSGMASRLALGSALVTGTNGKTTTARLVRNIVQAAGMRPVGNRAGSNMMRGIASALVESAGWSGRMDGAGRRMGIFEVDEATVPKVAGAVAPRAILFTNLFRDQLDRYGEVEHVAELWREAARRLPESVTLVLNADDPSVASLREVATGQVVLYGLDDERHAVQKLEHAADARWCSGCGAELEYAAVFYGHIGRWRCPGCGASRPDVQAGCLSLDTDSDGMRLTIRLPDGEVSARLPLSGVYNAYNAIAAAACAFALGLPPAAIEEGLSSFRPAFGRQERLRVRGREVQVMLAKNPAGLNQVLRTMTQNGEARNLAFFLNDNIADGRDISWIWDVDFELLAGKTGSITVSGARAWDMALRLKYAGLGSLEDVAPDTPKALRRALERTPEGETLYVIPTYTAMLQVRNILGRWSGRGAFWEGDR
jgi:UDP-N-acetylmuramyl tripeptide synthase